MNELFRAETSLDKETCKQFGRVSVRRMKSFRIIYIIGIVQILLGGLGMIFPVFFGAFSSFGILGITICVYVRLICVIIPSRTFKNVNKSKRNISDKLTFFDSYFVSDSELGTAQMNYSAIEKVLESETAFYLFLNKSSAQIVNKNTLQIGRIDSFREFIADRTGCSVKFYSSKKRTVLNVLSFAVPVLLFILLFFISVIYHPMETFVKDNYSVKLDSYFIQQEDEELNKGVLTAFYDGDWYISVSKIKCEDYSSPEKLLNEKYLSAEIIESSENSDRIIALCEKENIDEYSEELSRCKVYVSVVKHENVYYVTDFDCCCLSDDYDDSQFKQVSKWADSISISE